METVIWIFNNVMPWVGVFYVVMTIIYLVLLADDIFRLNGIKNIHNRYDITEGAMDGCVIVNIIPMAFIWLIAFSVEKIIKRSRAKKRKKTMKCQGKDCNGELDLNT